MKAWSFFLILVCLIEACDHAAATEPKTIRYPDGSWFIPHLSGEGPPLTQVKTFIMRNGDICENLAVMMGDSRDGLLCRHGS
jgi:hypothetical protein